MLTEELRNEALECLKEELEGRTPLTEYTEEANVKLINEYFTLNESLVEEAVLASTDEDGALNPFGVIKRLMSGLIEHCGNRVAPPRF